MKKSGLIKKNLSSRHSDFISIQNFLLTKIKSPYMNFDYEIKSGDSIQKILKKLKIQNNEIQTIIKQYTSFQTIMG